ncbi:MAG: hypothetical protein HYT39_02755, partial [Candidatus Sungbacteria bacterium]|nr:hypothetical protein [Candidatus Sungbacteria bacterium]
VLDTTVVNCGGGSVTMPRPSGSCGVPLKRDDQFYTYAGSRATLFSRCVDVCSPPDGAPCNAAPDSDIPRENQMDVVSTVTWRERDAERAVVLKERLYNWR